MLPGLDFGYPDVLQFEEKRGWKQIAQLIFRNPRSGSVFKKIEARLLEVRKEESRRDLMRISKKSWLTPEEERRVDELILQEK